MDSQHNNKLEEEELFYEKVELAYQEKEE